MQDVISKLHKPMFIYLYLLGYVNFCCLLPINQEYLLRPLVLGRASLRTSCGTPCAVMSLKVHVSERAQAAFCSCPTLGTPAATVKPIAPGWYIGLFFIQTCDPQTISVCAFVGRCLRDFALYFSQSRFLCANGNTPLKVKWLHLK